MRSDSLSVSAAGKNATATLFESVKLPAGPGRFEAYLKLGRLASGVHYVDVERID